MNNDLREQIAYKLIKIHKLGRVGADFDDKEADELITIIRTDTLDEVKGAVLDETYSGESGGMIKVSDVLEAIDNLRGNDE